MINCKITFLKKPSDMIVRMLGSIHYFYAKDFFKTFVVPFLESQLPESMLELTARRIQCQMN